MDIETIWIKSKASAAPEEFGSRVARRVESRRRARVIRRITFGGVFAVFATILVSLWMGGGRINSDRPVPESVQIAPPVELSEDWEDDLVGIYFDDDPFLDDLLDEASEEDDRGWISPDKKVKEELS